MVFTKKRIHTQRYQTIYYWSQRGWSGDAMRWDKGKELRFGYSWELGRGGVLKGMIGNDGKGCLIAFWLLDVSRWGR